MTHEAKRTWVKRTEQSAHKLYSQAVRSAWRALCLLLKAKLVGIAEKATTFEVEFMPYMVTPNGQTVAERMMPAINRAQESGQLLLTMEAE